MIRLMPALRVSLAAAFLALTGCQNGNLFGKLHDSGDSSDPAILASDAAIALNNKDFAGALDLYERILSQDPDNAAALNGAAIAAVGAAGLNFGTIVANIARNNAAPGIMGLQDLVAAAREGVSAQDAEPNSVLAGVDLERLDAVIDLAICRLSRIVSGVADGSISSVDGAVLIDLALLTVIRATLRPLRADFFDFVNDNGNYKIVAKTEFNTFCGNSANHPLVVNVAQDLVNSYALFNRAVDVLGLGASSIVSKIRTDLDAAIEEALDGDTTDDIPAACVAAINGAGITAANFRSRATAFSPPSGC